MRFYGGLPRLLKIYSLQNLARSGKKNVYLARFSNKQELCKTLARNSYHLFLARFLHKSCKTLARKKFQSRAVEQLKSPQLSIVIPLVVCLGIAVDVDVKPAGPECGDCDAFAYFGFCECGIVISKTTIFVPNFGYFFGKNLNESNILVVSNFRLSR